MRECTPALSLERRRDRSPPGPFRHRWRSIPRASIATYEHEVWALVAPTFRIILVLPIGKPNHRTAPHRTRPRKGEPPEGWLQLAQLVAHYCTYGVCVGSRSMYSRVNFIVRPNVSAARTHITIHMAVGPLQWDPRFRPGRSLRRKERKGRANV